MRIVRHMQNPASREETAAYFKFIADCVLALCINCFLLRMNAPCGATCWVMCPFSFIFLFICFYLFSPPFPFPLLFLFCVFSFGFRSKLTCETQGSRTGVNLPVLRDWRLVFHCRGVEDERKMAVVLKTQGQEGGLSSLYTLVNPHPVALLSSSIDQVSRIPSSSPQLLPLL